MGTQNVFVSRVDDFEFEPFLGADGSQAGDVNWLRTTESEGKVLKAGLWHCEPLTADYPFLLDETFVMIEGRLIVDVEGGERYEFGPGDTASFAKGTQSTWTVTETVVHFFLQCG